MTPVKSMGQPLVLLEDAVWYVCDKHIQYKNIWSLSGWIIRRNLQDLHQYLQRSLQGKSSSISQGILQGKDSSSIATINQLFVWCNLWEFDICIVGIIHLLWLVFCCWKKDVFKGFFRSLGNILLRFSKGVLAVSGFILAWVLYILSKYLQLHPTSSSGN